MSGSRQEEIFDLLLEQAMDEQVRRELDAMPSDEELRQMYPLSKKFQKDMDRLIAKEKKLDGQYLQKKRYKKICRVACTAAACLICVLFVWQVPTVRAAVMDYVEKFYEGFVQIGEPDSDLTEVIDPMKDPDYIPEGYVEVSRVEDEKVKNLQYKSDDDVLKISYYDDSEKENSNVMIDKNVGYTKIKLLVHIEAFWSSNEKKCVLWWESNGFTYCIRANLSQDEMIKIAESILK